MDQKVPGPFSSSTETYNNKGGEENPILVGLIIGSLNLDSLIGLNLDIYEHLILDWQKRKLFLEIQNQREHSKVKKVRKIEVNPFDALVILACHSTKK